MKIMKINKYLNIILKVINFIINIYFPIYINDLICIDLLEENLDKDKVNNKNDDISGTTLFIKTVVVIGLLLVMWYYINPTEWPPFNPPNPEQNSIIAEHW